MMMMMKIIIIIIIRIRRNNFKKIKFISSAGCNYFGAFLKNEFVVFLIFMDPCIAV
jgi:hypothetical protein